MSRNTKSGTLKQTCEGLFPIQLPCAPSEAANANQTHAAPQVIKTITKSCTLVQSGLSGFLFDCSQFLLVRFRSNSLQLSEFFWRNFLRFGEVSRWQELGQLLPGMLGVSGHIERCWYWSFQMAIGVRRQFHSWRWSDHHLAIGVRHNFGSWQWSVHLAIGAWRNFDRWR